MPVKAPGHLLCPLQLSGVGSAQGLRLHVASKPWRGEAARVPVMRRTAVDRAAVPSAPCLQSSRSTASPLTGGKGKLQRPGQLVTVTSWEGKPGLLGPGESQSPRPEPLCLLPDLARGPVNASLSHALTSAPGTCFLGSGEVQELVSILKKTFHKLLWGGQVCPCVRCHRYPQAGIGRARAHEGMCGGCTRGVTRRLQRRRYISELGHSFCSFCQVLCGNPTFELLRATTWDSVRKNISFSLCISNGFLFQLSVIC